MTYQETFTLHTRGRGTFEITDQVQGIVHKAGVKSGGFTFEGRTSNLACATCFNITLLHR